MIHVFNILPVNKFCIFLKETWIRNLKTHILIHVSRGNSTQPQQFDIPQCICQHRGVQECPQQDVDSQSHQVLYVFPCPSVVRW